jgi:hypothetical protein
MDSVLSMLARSDRWLHRSHVGGEPGSSSSDGKQMANSQWNKIYSSKIAASPEYLFGLLADLPHYVDWLPSSARFAATIDVEPYPVQLGTKYHDGKPGQAGKEWWGTVTGFQPPGSIDFHHSIVVKQLQANVDVHIHYSLEPEEFGTRVDRWLVLDVVMPSTLRPMRRAITSTFEKENLRTMAALKTFAEANSGGEELPSGGRP